MPRPSHPRSCVFEQAVLQGEIGHHLLQCSGLLAESLHLRAGVARQPALVSFGVDVFLNIIQRVNIVFTEASALFPGVALDATIPRALAAFVCSLGARSLPTDLRE